MPSVTDIQQQSSKVSSNNNNGKLTPPPQQQQISSITSGSPTDPTNADPIIQATLLLEKKQRNLSKRKEKLEGYEQEAKSGKELNKDQKEALSKYAEVLGQIECVKDISEQLKKIQTDLAKNQKRLAKQAAEEKRSLITQRMREYAQIRYLLDHRPTSLKEDESSLLDELSRLIIPSDSSLNTINRSVDTVLSIYQGGPSSSTIKNLTGRTSQEIRQIFEELIQQFQTNDLSNNQQIQTNELIKQTPIVPQVPPTTPASVLTQRELNQQQSNNNNNNNDVIFPTLTSHTHLVQTNRNEYPLQFDTRNQNIPLQQIIQDNTFFPVDITNTNTNTNNNQQDLINNPTNDQKQFLQTFNQHLTGQSSAQTVTESQSSSSQQQQQQQGINNYDQENSSNVGNSTNILTDEQQREDEWQHRRTNSGNAHRSQQYNGSANRNSYRGAYNTNNYNNQQHWRGSRGAAGGQRPYHENANRGGNGVYPNYRGNRGGSYRGANRGGNGNGYQKSSQYQQSNEQYQQQQ